MPSDVELRTLAGVGGFVVWMALVLWITLVAWRLAQDGARVVAGGLFLVAGVLVVAGLAVVAIMSEPPVLPLCRAGHQEQHKLSRVWVCDQWAEEEIAK